MALGRSLKLSASRPGETAKVSLCCLQLSALSGQVAIDLICATFLQIDHASEDKTYCG